MRRARGRPQVARAIEPAISIPDVDLVQGTHIVVPMRVTRGIYYVESPSDGRAVFVMPWQGATLIGTTETPYRGEPDQVQPAARGRGIFARRGAPLLPGCGCNDARATSCERFAGLRVLPAASQAAFDRSRETIFTTDRDPHPRVLGIYGGKLTGWRAAAAHVLERISPSLAVRPRRAATDQLVLRRVHDQVRHRGAGARVPRDARAR